MRKKLLGLAVAAALVSAPALAPAAITLQTPGFGTDRAVNGSGSAPDAWVELFVNGVSQGSVQADASGDFQFVATLVTGDEVVVTQSLVWNFDDDLEGWTSGNASAVLSHNAGTMVMTFQDPAPGPFDPYIVAPAVGGINSTVHRVLEFRWRNGSPANVFQIYQNDGTFELPADQFAGIQRQNATDFVTDQFALDLDPSNNVTTWVANNPVQLLRIDTYNSGGDVPGDYFGTTIEFDFIRIKEYHSIEFNTDGDLHGYTMASDGINEAVANGVLTYEIDDVNTDTIIDAILAPDATAGLNQSSIDPAYYTHFAIGGAINAPSSSQVSFFFTDAGGGYAVDGNIAGFGGLTLDGSRFDLVEDIAGVGAASWTGTEAPVVGGTVGDAIRYDVPDNGGAIGDTVEIDYLRFQTANPYGPSAPVTVSSNPGDDPDPEPQVNWPIQVVETSTPPTLDGVIDTASEWAPAGFAVPIAFNLSTLTIADPYFPSDTHNGGAAGLGNSDNTGSADISAVMYYMYDANALYIGVEATDELNVPSTAAPNGGDAFQLCLDYDNQFATAGSTTTGIYIPSWRAETNNSQNDGNFFEEFFPTTSPAVFTATTWQMTTNANGYTLEARIPWSDFEDNGNTITGANSPVSGYMFNGMPILLDFDDTPGSANPYFVLSGGGTAGLGAIGNASLWDTTFILTDNPVELPAPPAAAGNTWNLYE